MEQKEFYDKYQLNKFLHNQNASRKQLLDTPRKNQNPELKLKENLNFNEDEIYILGFSQGADLALSTGFKFPNFYKGIISLCGYFDIKKIEYDLDYNALKKLKIFLSSAVYDDKVPVHLGRMTHLSLKKMKLSPTYFEYNTGHTISNECLTNVLDWLSLTKK